MKRHPALVPFSHDHHHGLAEARRLRRAADDADVATRRDAARRFVGFFSRETALHFREEEEMLFPLLLELPEPPPDLLVTALVEHARIRGLVDRLRRELAADRDPEATLRELGDLLEAHIRLEERALFPLIEERVAEEALAGLQLPPRSEREPDAAPSVIDLGTFEGKGPLWGTASEELNATLLAWPPGSGTPEHVNVERDVLVVVLDGSGTVWIDGEPRPLRPATAVLLRKGRSRRIVAGSEGLRYVSVHRRREGLQIGSHPAAPRGVS